LVPGFTGAEGLIGYAAAKLVPELLRSCSAVARVVSAALIGWFCCSSC